MTVVIEKTHDNLGLSPGAERQDALNYNKLLRWLKNTTFTNPGFAIDTNFDVKNGNAISYTLSGVLKTLSANTSFDTGTAATITATLWGIAILTYNGSASAVTWYTTSAAQSFATEALAKAALGSGNLVRPSGSAILGYITVQAGASLWTAGTDALATGTGGTPANATNYYNDPTLDGTIGGSILGDENGTELVNTDTGV